MAKRSTLVSRKDFMGIIISFLDVPGAPIRQSLLSREFDSEKIGISILAVLEAPITAFLLYIHIGTEIEE